MIEGGRKTERKRKEYGKTDRQSCKDTNMFLHMQLFP